MAFLPLDSNVATMTVLPTKMPYVGRGQIRWRCRMIFIKQFDELGRTDIDQAAGKGANLGELGGQPPVPPGFVIITDAYRGYVAEHQLAGKIATLATQG